MNIQKIIGIILIILIIFFTYKKNNEYFDNKESIMNIAKMYADASGTAYFNNISVNNININNNRARFVRIGNDLPGTNIGLDYWNITSVKVFDISGNIVSDDKTVTIAAGAQWIDDSGVVQSGEPSIITKPVPTFNKTTGNYIDLYQGGAGVNALIIDLGQEYNLSQIIIWGRYLPAWYQRLNNTSIQLIAEDGVTVKKTIYTGTWETLSKEFYL